MVEGRYRGQLVGVLVGGLSAEREISMLTGRAVARALRRRGYSVRTIPADRNLAARLRRGRVAVAFNALHGRYGEDGCVQGLLEVMGIPYTGAGVLASGLGMNKAMAKSIWSRQGLPTPPWRLVRPGEAVRTPGRLPLLVKPNGEGSSLGVSVVRRRSELAAAVRRARAFDREVLIERFVAGREVTVGILDGRAVGAMEIIPRDADFHTYEVKYTAGREDFVVPAPLEAWSYRRVCRLAEHAHRALGVEGYSRVDFRVDRRGRPFVIELNTLPGLTDLSWLPRLAVHAGLGFDDLVEGILDGARCKVHETVRCAGT